MTALSVLPTFISASHFKNTLFDWCGQRLPLRKNINVTEARMAVMCMQPRRDRRSLPSLIHSTGMYPPKGCISSHLIGINTHHSYMILIPVSVKLVMLRSFSRLVLGRPTYINITIGATSLEVHFHLRTRSGLNITG